MLIDHWKVENARSETFISIKGYQPMNFQLEG